MDETQVFISPGSLIGFLLGPFGTLALSLFILYAGYKGWWVFGWYAKELKARNEKLESHLDHMSELASGVTAVAERVMNEKHDK